MPSPRCAGGGFWCERSTRWCPSADGVEETGGFDAVHGCRAADAARAVRIVRADVRALVSALPPAERARVVTAVDEHGRVGALAALHRGEPCGFSLDSEDIGVEWSVLPVVFLALAGTATGARCGHVRDRVPVRSELSSPLVPGASASPEHGFSWPRRAGGYGRADQASEHSSEEGR